MNQKKKQSARELQCFYLGKRNLMHTDKRKVYLMLLQLTDRKRSKMKWRSLIEWHYYLSISSVWIMKNRTLSSYTVSKEGGIEEMDRRKVQVHYCTYQNNVIKSNQWSTATWRRFVTWLENCVSDRYEFVFILMVYAQRLDQIFTDCWLVILWYAGNGVGRYVEAGRGTRIAIFHSGP